MTHQTELHGCNGIGAASADGSTADGSTADASAFLAFTGERMIPGQVEIDLYQEHMARYLLAGRLAAGRRVLDVGCGVGYGTAELARDAALSVGVDVAPDAISYAREQYGVGRARFGVADAAALPFADASFDMVVSFEVVEHVPDPSAFMREVARVLRPNGLALISTPNRRKFSDAIPNYDNPFHEREYYADEFVELLAGVFPAVHLLCQNYSQAQTIAEAGEDAPSEYVARLLDRTDDRVDREDAQLFVGACGFDAGSIAAAHRTGLAVLAGGGNILTDKNRWIALLQKELAARDGAVRELQATVDERTTWAQRSADEVTSRDAAVRELQGALDERTAWAQRSADELAEREKTVRELQGALDERTAWARRSADELAEREETVRELQGTLDERTAWAQLAADEVAARDAAIRELHTTLDERTVWAQRAADEAESRAAAIQDLQAQHDAAIQELGAQHDADVRELRGQLETHETELAMQHGTREAFLQSQLDATRLTLQEQTEHLDALVARIELVNRQQDDLRAQLEGAQAQYRRREDDILVMRAREVYFQNQVILREQQVTARDAQIGQQIDQHGVETGQLRAEIARLVEEIARLMGEIDRHGAEAGQFVGKIGRLVEEIELLNAEVVRLGHERDSWHGELVRAHEELEHVRSSRLWQVGASYWRARARLGKVFGA